jgi:hypothetical protein
MAKKKGAPVMDAPDRQLAFRAPDIVHGGLKEIVGRLEKISYRVDGKPASGQDILNWLIGELYMDGPEKWPGRVTAANRRYVDFANQN